MKTNLRLISDRSDTIPNKVLKFVVRFDLTVDKIRIHDEHDEVQKRFDHESTRKRTTSIVDSNKKKTKRTIQAASSDSTIPFQRIITIAKIKVSHISSIICSSVVEIVRRNGHDCSSLNKN